MFLKNRTAGFSLIELMIVVAIVAILATVSVGGYNRYMMRSNRTEALGALLQIQLAQEKFFLQNNTYAGSAQIATAVASGGLGIPTTTAPGGFYTLAISPAAPTTSYRVTATPVTTKGQSRDTDCASFTIDNTGRKSAVNSSGTDNTAVCWR